MHEHLILEFHRWKREAGIEIPAPSADPRARAPVTLETSYWARRHGHHVDEHRLRDEAIAIREANLFRKAGGGTIVDATNPDLSRDPEALARISRTTGLHIVMGSGRYLGSQHPPDMDSRTEEELTAEIVADVTDGADGTTIRSGIIGEIGTEYPITDSERKALRAAVRAQRITGAALSIHPGRDPAAPFAVMDVVREAGGDPARTIVGHLDRTLFDREAMRRLGATGCYLEFDLFGQESSFYQYAPIDMPNDATRVDHLIWLSEQGFADRLLISQDICRRTCLVTWGGWGYAHILEHVVPLMERKGMSEAWIDRLLVTNPARILELTAPF